MNAFALHLDQPCRYPVALQLQEELHALRLADAIPDTVLFLEHTPVITLGRRGRKEFLLSSGEALARRGIEVVVASRGGDVTYHGPGQLVMYPILKFGTGEADAHGYLANLERIAIETAQAFGARAFRRDGMSGAWIDAGKIAAIGFHIKRWVTMHGLSFNVDCDLTGFSHIVGCGLVGESVANLIQVPEARAVTTPEVRQVMVRVFQKVMERSFQTLSVGDIADETAIRDVLSRLTNC